MGQVASNVRAWVASLANEALGFAQAAIANISKAVVDVCQNAREHVEAVIDRVCETAGTIALNCSRDAAVGEEAPVSNRFHSRRCGYLYCT
jgi:hypothetical protein